MLLFCPHCDDIIEILGLPPRPMPQCETEGCGAVLEAVVDLEAARTFKTSFEAVLGKPGQER